MITKWKTSSYSFTNNPIQRVECERETKSCVWAYRRDGETIDRHNKRGAYENYFDTFDEAKAFLVNRAERRVELALNELDKAFDHQWRMKALTEPCAADVGGER